MGRCEAAQANHWRAASGYLGGRDSNRWAWRRLLVLGRDFGRHLAGWEFDGRRLRFRVVDGIMRRLVWWWHFWRRVRGSLWRRRRR